VQDSLPRLSDDSSKRYKFESVDVSMHPDFMPLSKVPKTFETPLLSIIHQKIYIGSDLTIHQMSIRRGFKPFQLKKLQSMQKFNHSGSDRLLVVNLEIS
jgi:hypothetical protein